MFVSSWEINAGLLFGFLMTIDNKFVPTRNSFFRQHSRVWFDHEHCFIDLHNSGTTIEFIAFRADKLVYIMQKMACSLSSYAKSSLPLRTV